MSPKIAAVLLTASLLGGSALLAKWHRVKRIVTDSEKCQAVIEDREMFCHGGYSVRCRWEIWAKVCGI